jgi:hypothetical protein
MKNQDNMVPLTAHDTSITKSKDTEMPDREFRILVIYAEKLPLKFKGEMKTFQNKRKLKFP